MHAPAHIGHGSNVTTNVQSARFQPCSAASRMAATSAWANGSPSTSRVFHPRPQYVHPHQAPVRLQAHHRSAARCANSSARRIASSSFIPPVYLGTASSPSPLASIGRTHNDSDGTSWKPLYTVGGKSLREGGTCGGIRAHSMHHRGVVVVSFLSRFIPKVSTPLVQIALGALASQLPFFPGRNAEPGTVHGAVHRAAAVSGSARNR